MEQHYITEMLRKTNRVVSGRSGAAARLGMPKTTLTSRTPKLGISRQNQGALPRSAA